MSGAIAPEPGLVAVIVHCPADKAVSVFALMTQGPDSLSTAVAPDAVVVARVTVDPATTGMGELAGHAP